MIKSKKKSSAEMMLILENKERRFRKLRLNISSIAQVKDLHTLESKQRRELADFKREILGEIEYEKEEKGTKKVVDDVIQNVPFKGIERTHKIQMEEIRLARKKELKERKKLSYKDKRKEYIGMHEPIM